MSVYRTLAAGILFAAALISTGQSAEIIGGDAYESGADVSLTGSQARDAFVAGFSAALDGTVAGDGHATGFDVEVGAALEGDLYLAGASVSLTGTVGEDLTATGFSIRTRDGSSVEGNARMMAGSINIDGAVAGSLMATGGSITFDAPVGGDVYLTGGSLNFGDDARIGGSLVYAAPEEIDIPQSVISDDRVRFVQLTRYEGWETMREAMDSPREMLWPSLVAMVGGFVLTLAFLLVVAAVFLAFMPRRVEEARQLASGKPGIVLLAGLAGIALLFGLVPVSAMTLIGVPFVPIVLLLIVATWIVAYLLGAYVLAMRVGHAFGAEGQSNAAKLAILAGALVVLAILNFVPFIGWIVNFAVILLGAGAVTLMVFGRLDVQSVLATGPEENSGEQMLPGVDDENPPKADAS